MQFINIHDAKTHLSRYLERVALSGETIVICRNSKPIAQLTAYVKPRLRKLGLLHGQITIREDFDSLPEEFVEYFR